MGCIVLVLGEFLGRCAFRPPRVVFVLGLVSLINSLTHFWQNNSPATVRKNMSSPPLRGTAEWSATREVALQLGLAGGNRYAAQQLWLRKERIKAEASQVASAGPPQASQQLAGYTKKYIGPPQASQQLAGYTKKYNSAGQPAARWLHKKVYYSFLCSQRAAGWPAEVLHSQLAIWRSGTHARNLHCDGTGLCRAQIWRSGTHARKQCEIWAQFQPNPLSCRLTWLPRGS